MPLPGSADVVVVGAGLAGLAAAVRLQDAGLDAVVVEVADAVGGRVRTDVVDGFRLDRGFQLLNPAYPEAERLLDLDALDLRAFDAGLAVRRDGRTHVLGDPLRMPSTLPVDLTAPVGSVRAKGAFGTWVAGLGMGSPDTIRERPDRSLMEELRARGLDGALTDRVLRPFLSGVLGEDELASSQRMASMLLRAFARGNPSVPAAGMQAMPDQLADRLAHGTLHLRVRAAGPVRGSGVDTDAGRVDARAVVVATDPVMAFELGAVPATPMRSLTTWWFAAPEPPTDRPLLHVDGDGGGPLANTVVMTDAAPTYGPGDGQALVAATAVGSHRDLAEVARAHAGRLYGVDPSRWELIRTDVIDGALPAHPPGQPLARRVDLGDGLFVAGDHRDTPSIQGALVSGRRAADAVVRRLRG
ncbi:FAD-dependent oxidoreductase [Nocardioides sp. GXQ0305]|uniref:FAD-dependent oxidoreductase n=1 Tax=Nocardioides sp. GXQ0305 TaxID=3423912 RepID=UPI003D7E3131